MKRIDLFLQNRKIYSLERHIISNLEKAFLKLGVETKKIFIEDGNILKYLREIEESPPDWTFSCMDLFVQKQALCSLTQIPHFCWENVSLSHSLHHLQSPLGHIGYVDRRFSTKNVSFLPHGFDSTFTPVVGEKKYDVVFFNDLVDCNDLEKNWEELFPQESVRFLQNVCDKCLNNPSLLPLEVIYKEMEKVPIECSVNYLLFLVEEFIMAKRVLERIEKIKDRRIDVFGEHIGNNWLRRLKNKENVYLHSVLPYTEYFEVLKQSKVLIRDQWKTPQGSDEWLFSALALGCNVVTNGSTFIQEELSLPFYKTLDEMEELVARTINAPKKEHYDLRNHTYEKRAETLLEYMHENRLSNRG